MHVQTSVLPVLITADSNVVHVSQCVPLDVNQLVTLTVQKNVQTIAATIAYIHALKNVEDVQIFVDTVV